MDLTNALNASGDTLDLQQVDSSTWTERSFPAASGRKAGVIPVVIKQSILNAIHRHGQERTDVEICGVLVGNGYRDEQGPFIYVEGAIRGDHAESQIAQVTFTGETWNHIHTILDTAWPQHRILAWYHTHPGFGIFLSGMDMFIHENFFGGAHQFALVYDPLSGDEGVFVWERGKPIKARCLVEPDEEAEARKLADTRHPEKQVTAGALNLKPEADWRVTVTQLRRQQRIIVIALAVIGVLAIIWPLLIAFALFSRESVPKPASTELPNDMYPRPIQVDKGAERESRSRNSLPATRPQTETSDSDPLNSPARSKPSIVPSEENRTSDEDSKQ